MYKVKKKKNIDWFVILDITLILVLTIIVVSIVYLFFEPKFVQMYTKQDIVSDTSTVDELEQCADKYFNALIYEKVYIVNEMQTIFNEKSIDEIKKIKDVYGDNVSYDLIVKQAYKLGNNVFLCNIEIIPEIDKDKYDWNNIKTAKLTIKLNRNNNTFKIFHDEFNINLEVLK